MNFTEVCPTHFGEISGHLGIMTSLVPAPFSNQNMVYTVLRGQVITQKMAVLFCWLRNPKSGRRQAVEKKYHVYHDSLENLNVWLYASLSMCEGQTTMQRNT